jgi:hypothetical protein
MGAFSEVPASEFKLKTLLSAEAKFVEMNQKGSLSNGEAIFFAISQEFFPFDEGKDATALLLSSLMPEVRLDRLVLEEIVAHMRLERIPTELDLLLPQGGYFARLPDALRRGVICTSPYAVKILGNDNPNSLNSLRDVKQFVARGIAGLGPADRSSDYELARCGKLAFDVADEFVKILLENASKILASPGIGQIVRDYFWALAYEFIEPSDQGEWFLDLKERELKRLLSVERKIQSAEERRGNVFLTLQGRHFRTAFDESAFWEMIDKTGKIVRSALI